MLILEHNQRGYTLVELLVVIVLVGIAFVSFGEFINGYTITYAHYQTDATNFTELDTESLRISQVLRGLTDIVTPNSNSLEIYAYFAPNDTYVSLVNYYLSGNGKQLLASVTPMTANPPIGTPITQDTRYYTIISNYFQSPGVNLFNYYDAYGDQLSQPITDEHSIIQIQVNLSEPGTYTKTGQTLSVLTSLRNRKTNL